MENVIREISFTILTIYFLIEFIKSKKKYNLYCIFIALSAVLFNTPLANKINKPIEILWVSIILILGLLTIYLGNKK